MKLAGKHKGMMALALGMILTIALSAIPAPALAAVRNTNLYGKIGDLKGTVTLYMSANANWGKSYCKYSCNPKKLSDWTSQSDVVSAYSYSYENALTLVALKPGTGYVDFTYGGKKHHVKVVVKKYKNPLSKLTVGSSNIASKFKSESSYVIRFSKLKGKKLSVTPAKGWQLKAAYVGHNKTNWVTYTKVRNNSKLPSASFDSVCLLMQNKKTKGYLPIYVVRDQQ